MSLVRKQFSFGDDVSFECYIYAVKKADGADEFWFKGHDVAEFLDYKKPRDAINNNVDVAWRREWRDLQDVNFGALANGTNNVTTPRNNCQPHTVFISEPGLYALVTRSKKPETLHWLCEDVLPSLRKTGRSAVASTGDDSISLVQLRDMEIKKLKAELETERIQSKFCKAEVALYKLQNGTVNKYDMVFNGVVARQCMERLNDVHEAIMDVSETASVCTNMDSIGRPDIQSLVVLFRVPDSCRYIVKRIQQTTLDAMDYYVISERNAVPELVSRAEKNPRTRKHERGTMKSVRELIDDRRKTYKCLIGQLIPVASAVNVWNMVRETYADKMFGLNFINKPVKCFEILNDERLLERFALHQNQQQFLGPVRRSQRNYNNKTQELKFAGVQDCFDRCRVADEWELYAMIRQCADDPGNKLKDIAAIASDTPNLSSAQREMQNVKTEMGKRNISNEIDEQNKFFEEKNYMLRKFFEKQPSNRIQ